MVADSDIIPMWGASVRVCSDFRPSEEERAEKKRSPAENL